MDYEVSRVIEREGADSREETECSDPAGKERETQFCKADEKEGYKDKESKADEKRESDQNRTRSTDANYQQERHGDTRDVEAQWCNNSSLHTEDAGRAAVATASRHQELDRRYRTRAHVDTKWYNWYNSVHADRELEESHAGTHKCSHTKCTSRKIAICYYFVALVLNACGAGLIFAFFYAFDDGSKLALAAAVQAAIGAVGIVSWGGVMVTKIYGNKPCPPKFKYLNCLKELGICLCCGLPSLVLPIAISSSVGVFQLIAACFMATAISKSEAGSNAVGFGVFATSWEFVTLFVSAGTCLVLYYI